MIQRLIFKNTDLSRLTFLAGQILEEVFKIGLMH